MDVLSRVVGYVNSVVEFSVVDITLEVVVGLVVVITESEVVELDTLRLDVDKVSCIVEFRGVSDLVVSVVSGVELSTVDMILEAVVNIFSAVEFSVLDISLEVVYGLVVVITEVELVEVGMVVVDVSDMVLELGKPLEVSNVVNVVSVVIIAVVVMVLEGLLLVDTGVESCTVVLIGIEVVAVIVLAEVSDKSGVVISVVVCEEDMSVLEDIVSSDGLVVVVTKVVKASISDVGTVDCKLNVDLDVVTLIELPVVDVVLDADELVGDGVREKSELVELVASVVDLVVEGAVILDFVSVGNLVVLRFTFIEPAVKYKNVVTSSKFEIELILL